MNKRTKRVAKGSGSIRKRPDGTWEARYTVGRDSHGKQIQHSIYGATQDEVRQKMASIIVSIDQNTYVDPCHISLETWLNNWLNLYARDSVKPYTFDQYMRICDNHIIPAIGQIKLKDINSLIIQGFYNDMYRKEKLSAKTVKNIHGVLHRSLQQAVKIGYLAKNPTELCDLPKHVKKKIKPLETEDIRSFLTEIKGHRYENLFYATLFSGTRQGEILGLTWDCVDFENSTILIDKQLQKTARIRGEYVLVPTKTNKERIIMLAPAVMQRLAAQKKWQEECKIKAGGAWSNPMNLVFTNEYGGHLTHMTTYKDYKEIGKHDHKEESKRNYMLESLDVRFKKKIF